MKGSTKMRLAGALVILGGLAGGQVAVCAGADARAVIIEPPYRDHQGKDPVLYVKHIIRRWHWVELADGRSVVVSRCVNDEVTGSPAQSCWWNGNTMGNGEGYSFLVLYGIKHRTVRGTLVLCAGGRPC